MDSRQYSRYNINPMESKGMYAPLLQLLSDITGIRLDALSSPENVISCSNGEKMLWMAGRETTREEVLILLLRRCMCKSCRYLKQSS